MARQGMASQSILDDIVKTRKTRIFLLAFLTEL